jgi:hypothetical protein
MLQLGTVIVNDNVTRGMIDRDYNNLQTTVITDHDAFPMRFKYMPHSRSTGYCNFLLTNIQKFKVLLNILWALYILVSTAIIPEESSA